MVLRLLAGAVAAVLALACFGLTPAAAGSHKGSHLYTSSPCCKAKKRIKAVAQCGKYCAIAAALAAKSGRRHNPAKWHGWVASRDGFAFYLNGARHKGGTPCGPPMAYNNWEGGFNRRAFWEIIDRDRY